MNKLKQYLSLFLSIAILLTVLCPTVAYAANDFEISLTESAGYPEEEVSLDIVLTNNPGFNALNVALSYNGEYFQIKSIENKVPALHMSNVSSIVWDGAENYNADGVLATVTFLVADKAPVGEHEIKLIFWGASNEAFEDISANEVNIISGTIIVTCVHANTTNIPEDPADCDEGGYTAGIWCNDCETCISGCEPIPATGNHTDANDKWESNEVNHFHTCDCGHIFDTAAHDGGTATCKERAKCSVCGAEYGLLNENNHTGGITVVNTSKPNHTTQQAGYTGDTKCNGCGEILSYGQAIPAGAHTPANVWSTDGEYHWKECTVVGCGIVIDGSKARHTSTGANVATCQKAAVCDVCGVSYGAVAAHDWNTSTWEKDAAGHWHACKTSGCTEKNFFAGHTPDHQGSATEEYAIKCSVCGYIIEQQLAHTHVFDKDVVDEQYKVSGATCLKPATYYKSCACGEKGTETFENGGVIDHTEGTEWKSDEDNHWHICTVAGCGVVIESSETAHTPDRAEATETDEVKCSVCEFVIAPALGHTHAYEAEWKSNTNNHWNECACGDKANTAAHKDENTDGKCDVCAYNVGIPADPSGPQTGDNNMIFFWIILLCISTLGVIATTAFGKKKSFRG